MESMPFWIDLILFIFLEFYEIIFLIWSLLQIESFEKYFEITKGHTLPFKMFGMGQKVSSRLAWLKFWPILANQETLAILHENEAKKIFFFWKKKFKMADLESSKWPPQKNLIFQLRQFLIFFHEIFMVWSLG